MPESEEQANWTTEIDSKYRLVLLAAERCKQLQRGAKPRVFGPARKKTRVAIEEVRRGLIQYQRITKPIKAE